MSHLFLENCASEGQKNTFLGGKNISHNLTSLEKNALLMHDSYDLNMFICMKKLWS